MFQCKDLLSLTTMSQADVIAGSGGMEKGIRWSYKAENINFPLFTMPWNVPLLDFSRNSDTLYHILDDRKDIEDSLLAEIILETLSIHPVSNKNAGKWEMIREC